MSAVQTECQGGLHQTVESELGRKLGHEFTNCHFLVADCENIVEVQHTNLDCSYDYLSYEKSDATPDVDRTVDQYVLGDEALSRTSGMKEEIVKRLSPSVEEHMEFVHFMDIKSRASDRSQDNQSMEYNTSNVIMVSMDENSQPTELQDVNAVTSRMTSDETKRNVNDIDYILHNKTTTVQSSNAVNIKTTRGYYCSKCKKSFNMKRLFLNHLQLHFKSKDFECIECGERFYQRHCLELHRVTHLDIRKSKTVTNKHLTFECKLCRTRFSSICHLKNHINMLHRHLNSSGTSEQNSLATSINATQPEVGHHICYHCQKTFSNQKIFSKHIKLHSWNFECIACPKSFDSKEELKLHNWTHFSSYSCSVCNSVFKSTKDWARHEGMCLTNLLSNKDFTGMMGSDKLLVCDVCSDVFVKKQEFQKHLHRHVKRFRCRHCGSGYHSQAALENHEKFHEFNSHMYKCSDCRKSFYSLPLLQCHQKKHVAENKQCSICKEVFKSEEQRQKHKHLFLGNVKCDLCSIQCSGSHGLNMHKRLAHPDARHTNLYPKTPKKSSEQIIVCLGDVTDSIQ